MPSTTRDTRGDIVLVSFPVTDLSSSKRRPALVVSPDSFNDTMQDLVLAAITSQGAEDGALTIDQGDGIEGILPKKSVGRPAKRRAPPSQLVRRYCQAGAPAGKVACDGTARTPNRPCLLRQLNKVGPAVAAECPCSGALVGPPHPSTLALSVPRLQLSRNRRDQRSLLG